MKIFKTQAEIDSSLDAAGNLYIRDDIEYTIRCSTVVTGDIVVFAKNETEAWDRAVRRDGKDIVPIKFGLCQPLKILNKVTGRLCTWP